MRMPELEYGFRMEDDPAFPLRADAVQLAHELVKILPENAHICELGCGAGAVGLLLCAARADVSYTGVELRPAAAELAVRNAAENGIADRFRVISGNVCGIRNFLARESFDAVCANPPYRKTDGGKLPQNPDTAIACTEIAGNIRDFCSAAAYLLPHSGIFSVIYPPERLPDLLDALRNTHLEPKTLLLIHPNPQKPACMTIVHARHGGKPGLTVTPPLFLDRI